MELRHLRYFMAVAEAQSFTRAAERLRISQPTLSHQIKQLESQTKAVLFDRGARSVGLTAAGRTFKPFCEHLLKELDAGVLAVSELEGLMRGTLRMAVFHSFSKSLLGPVLSEFAMRYPGVHVVARLVPRLEMEKGLLSGELDFAVAYVSDDSEHIVAETLFEEELVLVVGSKHSLASRRSIPMRALGNMDLVFLTQEFAARQFLDRFIAQNKLEPRVVLEMNAIDAILSTIRNSRLASVLSAGAVGDTKGVRAISLTNPSPKRVAAILWRRNGHRSAAAQRMAGMIKAAYKV
jgi:LysR family cyn operon transcriptional activator